MGGHTRAPGGNQLLRRAGDAVPGQPDDASGHLRLDLRAAHPCGEGPDLKVLQELQHSRGSALGRPDLQDRHEGGALGPGPCLLQLLNFSRPAGSGLREVQARQLRVQVPLRAHHQRAALDAGVADPARGSESQRDLGHDLRDGLRHVLLHRLRHSDYDPIEQHDQVVLRAAQDQPARRLQPGWLPRVPAVHGRRGLHEAVGLQRQLHAASL
mmetsp:Transcript_18408/g.31486  ORF Transcript_18408/g.31486 Transcript_18408/m.31486 type:complete len:212 (-) Transcript_18408:249-884(-)